MSTATDVLDTLEKLEKSIKEAGYILKSELRLYYKGCMAASKFKVGDRIQLSKTPVINEKEAWGWMRSKHFLIMGAIGTVKEVDYSENVKGEGVYIYSISFDDETIMLEYPISGSQASVHSTPHRHEYSFGESYLEKYSAFPNFCLDAIENPEFSYWCES